MKPRTTFIVLLLTGLIIAGGYYATELAIDRKNHIMRTIGFQNLDINTIQKSLSQVVFKDIALDRDNLSTIKQISTAYNYQGQASMLFEDINLTGDTLGGDLNIENFTFNDFPYALATLPIDQIILKDARLNLLTKNWGGFSIGATLQASRKDNKTTFQGTLSSSQKQLTLDASVSGTILRGEWITNGRIRSAKFDLMETLQTQITRANGSFSFSQKRGQPILSNIQIQAGGAKILSLPWRNISASLKNENNTPRIYITAQSLGGDTIELNVTIEKNIISATLFAPTKSNLTSYFQKNKKDEWSALLKDIPEDTQDLSIALAFDKQKNELLGAAKAESLKEPVLLTISLSDFLSQNKNR